MYIPSNINQTIIFHLKARSEFNDTVEYMQKANLAHCIIRIISVSFIDVIRQISSPINQNL